MFQPIPMPGPAARSWRVALSRELLAVFCAAATISLAPANPLRAEQAIEPAQLRPGQIVFHPLNRPGPMDYPAAAQTAEDAAAQDIVSAIVTATPQQAASLPFYPLGGRLWQDIKVVNYVDLNQASPGIQAFDCTQSTYDGHSGHDVLWGGFPAMAIGIPVFAALDGVVTVAHDGEADTNAFTDLSTQCVGVKANEVTLSHGGGHTTRYIHLAKGSITVSVGQTVKAGTQIGLVGSSGCSTEPHLHFESQLNGNPFEPFAGSCRAGASNFVTQPTNPGTFRATDLHFTDRGGLVRKGAFVVNNAAQEVWVSLRLINSSSAASTLTLRRPDGANGATLALGALGGGGNVGIGAVLNVVGTWRWELSRNGQAYLSAPFEVVSSSAQIVNRAPNGVSASLEPPTPAATSAVFCRVNTTLHLRDADYDLVRYRYQWRVNGTVIRDVTSAVLSDAIPAQGNNVQISCTVTPSDGALTAAQATAAASIGTLGSISGRVVNTRVQGGPEPLAGVNVQAFRAGTFVAGAVTNASGDFAISGLSTGSYNIRTINNIPGGYIDQLYGTGFVPCLNCDTTAGTFVDVTAPNATPNINFSLATGSAIAGTITNATTKAPVPSVLVGFFNHVGTQVGSATTNASGVYTSSGFPGGTYFVRTLANNLGLINQLHSNINCLGCSAVSGTPMALGLPQTYHVDMALSPGAQITGTVRRADTSAGIAALSVQLFSSSNAFLTSTTTNSTGAYTLSGVPPGSYYIKTVSNVGFIDQVYADTGNQTCLQCNPQGLGSLITVTGTSTTSGIDFSLTSGGSISGTIASSASPAVALAGVLAQLFDSSGAFIKATTTTGSGAFKLSGLPAGSYYLRTSNSLGYINVVYNGATGATCLNCSVTAIGTPIAITAGAEAGPFGLVLTLGKTITGTVTVVSAKIAGVTVQAYAPSGAAGSAVTDSSGKYTISGLPAGSYSLRTFNSAGYVDGYWPLGYAAWVSDMTKVAGVNLTTASSVTADIPMFQGWRLKGKVTDAATGLPLPGARVSVYAEGVTAPLFTAIANDVGEYATPGLHHAPPTPSLSRYYATATGTGYVTQLYDAIGCGASCSPFSGTVLVKPSTGDLTVRSGVDFALAIGGRVTGTVTDSSTTSGVESVTVNVFDAVSGAFARSGTTTASGSFSVVGLPTGNYVARTSNSIGYIDELYDNLKCASCSAITGKSFAVTAGGTTSGINFQLDRGGRISGTVTAAAGGAVISGVSVSVYDSLNRFVASGFSNQNGVYATSGLAPGTYFVRTTFNSGNYVNQLYLNAPCTSCNAATGKPVTVTGTTTTSGVDFALVQGGAVSGFVGNRSATAQSGVFVSIVDANNAVLGSATTASNGQFTVSGLPSGTYYARTSNSLGLVDEVFNGPHDGPYSGLTCLSCNVTSGKSFVVQAGTTYNRILFLLAPGAAISGKVTDAGNAGDPIENVNVQVFSANGAFVQGVATRADGSYRTTAGLPAGNYFARTANSKGYVDKVYNDTTCLGCSVLTGAPIAVSGEAATPGIDFSLVSGGVITGKAVARATGLPLQSVSINVFTASGLFVTGTSTNGQGTYRTTGMPAGSYFVRTGNSLGLINQLYNSKDCTGCNPSLGAPVAVTVGGNTTGIDFSLPTGGRIRGTVTTDGGAVAPGITVNVYSAAGDFVANGFTDSSGNYVTPNGLPSGTYYAVTTNSSGLVNLLYDGLSCAGCSATSGKPIAVTTGADTTGINFLLSLGGRLAGLVTDTASPPAPIAGARVSIYTSTGALITSATTGNSGKYATTAGLPAGSYFVKASAPGGVISALYKVQTSVPNNVNCPSCSPLTGSPVAVVAGATTGDIDFALTSGGLITGTASDFVSGVPVSSAKIDLYDQTNGFISTVETDSAGRFTSGSGVPPGTYYAVGTATGYLKQFYNDACQLSCRPNSGTPIRVTLGATTSAVDFKFKTGGRVTGRVTDAATGLPVSGVDVNLFNTVSTFIAHTVFTDNDGAFAVDGLLPGSYWARVAFGNYQGYVMQAYGNVNCIYCSFSKTFEVAGSTTTTNINFALIDGGGISGRVTSTDTTGGIRGVSVYLHNLQGAEVARADTNADGQFTFRGLLPSSYLVRTANYGGFVDEVFDNKVCSGCPPNSAGATPITVTGKNTTTGINFSLDTGGRVSGQVTNAVTGAPVALATMAFYQDGVLKGRTQTGPTGYYSISLPAGVYTVIAESAWGYSVIITPGTRTAAGPTVTVTKGAETSNVSFPLTACSPPTVSPDTLSIFTAGQPYTQRLTASGGTAPYSFSVSSGSLPPGLTLNAATGVISGTPSISGTASFSVAAADAVGCTGTVDYTPFVCGVSAGATQASFTSAAAAGTLALAANAAECTWTATSNAPWLTPGSASGTGNATLAYSVAANTSNAFRTGTITVAGNTLTVTQGGAVTEPPFGSFDTPTGAAVASGSIAVSGWALDDIGVDRVEIWRDRVVGETTPVFTGAGPGNGKIYIANPLFVTGARSDVAAAFASYPFANRAGWGYLMLTQGLWNQGNGTYTLYAFAFDQEGKSTTLGSRTITVDNANAVKPFGSIDTPTYGQTTAGSFWNFGWALTPGTACLITNGNVFMSIDSGTLTPVSYGGTRADIASAFPGFTNGSGAGGAFYLDTTTLTDGAHQIGWYVVDNCNRAEGIGSRFFTVANGTSSAELQDVRTGVIDAPLTAPVEGRVASRAAETVHGGAVTVRTDGGDAVPVPTDADGWRMVVAPQGSRVEVQLPLGHETAYSAYQIANGERTALPLGSSFDAAAGVFAWEPAPGYLGGYHLVFVAPNGAAIPLRVVVRER